MVQMFLALLLIICVSVRPGFQGHCRSQFSQSHKTCKSHRHLTFSSADVVTAMCGACCRLSGASLLCDLPTEKHSRTFRQLGWEVNASDSDLACTSECSSKLTCISPIRQRATLCEGVFRHILYRKLRGWGTVEAGNSPLLFML